MYEFLIDGYAQDALHAAPDPDGSHVQIALITPPGVYIAGGEARVVTNDNAVLRGRIVQVRQEQVAEYGVHQIVCVLLLDSEWKG